MLTLCNHHIMETMHRFSETEMFWHMLYYLMTLFVLGEIDDCHLVSMQYVAIVLFQISGPTDLGNFEKFPKEKYVPPDETSGWDKDF